MYIDYETGRIWGVRANDDKVVSNGELIDRSRESHLNIAFFGEDPQGEIYFLAFDGRIYRLMARQ